MASARSTRRRWSKEACLWATGDLPKSATTSINDAEEDYYFVPTAEVPLTNLWRDAIIDPGLLPLRYVAYTPCFRREKMSAGRDVRGIKRGHQFDKVEMYTSVRRKARWDEFERMTRKRHRCL